MPEKRTTVSEAEEIELEWKRLQSDIFREQIQERNDRKARSKANRDQQTADFKKSLAERAHRQRICKHRKGGRDNKFANGNDANYSIVTNTYPAGDICIMCSRCGKEVWKPKLELRKTNPELFKSMMAEFKQWADYPTDNTPSGSKIFEIVPAA
jgi:deferrochelatase/peroxidase EfeB